MAKIEYDPESGIMAFPDEMVQMIEPETAVRVFYNEGNQNNQIRHIRAIVDGSHVVYRVWSKRKRCWIYHVDDLYAFWLLYEKGYMTNA